MCERAGHRFLAGYVGLRRGLWHRPLHREARRTNRVDTPQRWRLEARGPKAEPARFHLLLRTDSGHPEVETDAGATCSGAGGAAPLRARRAKCHLGVHLLEYGCVVEFMRQAWARTLFLLTLFLGFALAA